MKHLKLFFALFAMLALGVGNAWGAEATINFSEKGLGNAVQYLDPFTIDANTTITFAGGDNDGKYYNTGTGIRTYGDGTITVECTNGTISEISFTWGGTSYKPTDDVATPAGYSTSTGNWTGSTSSVTLTRPSGSGHWRLQKVTVTYETAGGSVTPDPDPTTYTIKWHTAKGVTTDVTLNEGATITKPATDPTMTGYEFMGWTASCDVASDGSDFTALTDFGTADSDKDFYAVFAEATTSGGGAPTETTASVTIQNYASANSWANGTKYASVKIDGNITASVTGSSNTGKYYTSGYEWRLYQTEAAKLTISTTEGKTIKTAKITYNVTNNGVLKLNSSNVTSGTTSTINASSVTYNVGNSGSATNGQVKVTAIEVVYTSGSAGSTTYSNYITTCSGSAPQPAVLVSIAKTAGKTEFTEGDTFEKATITATYDDATTKDVTSLATFTGYDMNTTGTQTVNVTYEGKSTSYTITVNPKPKYTITWNNAGTTTTTEVVQGEALGTLSEPADCPNGKKFMGWSATDNFASDGSDITYVKKTDVPTGNTTYYAVFSVVEGGNGTPTTATQSIKTYAEANSWTNESKHTEIPVDANITATVTGGSNTGKYYTSGTNWRLYQTENATLTISAVAGYEIQTVKVTYANSNNGVLTLAGSNVTSETASEVNAESVTFGVGNTGSATNGQVRITDIEVVYAPAAAKSDYSLDCELHQDPYLTVLETAIDFGTVAQNETATETFNVTGGYLAENVALTISGTNASFFSVSPATITKADEVNETVTVTYEPTEVGDHTATLTIKTGDITKEIALSGKVLAPGKWVLVKDVATLSAGDEIIIASAVADYAIGVAATNNYKGAAITKVGETANTTADVTILTVEETGIAEVPYAFKDGSKYLYAAGSDKNYLKAQATNNENGQWAITITEGVASIVAAKSSNRNVMQCNPNSGNPIFACYTSADYQQLAIYRNSENVVKPVISGDADFVGSTQVTITSQSGLTVYYTTDGTDPNNTSAQYTAPFTINATTTVKAIAYDASSNASGVAEMTFTKHDLVNVATAMALEKDEIAYFDEFEVVKVVTGKGNIYIKDASGHGLIYDNTLAGELKDGDRVQGFVGISSPYNGLPEAKPVDGLTVADLTITSGVAAEPYDFTSTAIAEVDINKYIVFNDVAIAANTDVSTNPTLTIGGNNVKFYNQFGISKTLEAGKTYDIYGFVAIYNSNLQVYFYQALEEGEVVTKYTVTYSAGGATGEVPVDDNEYTEGAQVYLKSATGLTKEGYDYKGWKVTDEGGDEIAVSSNKFNMPASNVTVTAQWEEIVAPEIQDFSTGYWVLVTDVNKIADGDKIVIAAADENFAMKSYESGNNCRQVAVTKLGDQLLKWTSEIGVFQLIANGSNYTIQDVNTEEYLYAAGTGSNNYLKAADEVPTDAEAAKPYIWTISYTDGVATVKATSDNRNTLMYNTGSDLFACYASGQQDIALYKYVTDYTYTRNVTNKFGTICLPYASASTSGAYFYHVAGQGVEKGNVAVYLESVEALEAGVPYIFEATAGTITVTCQGEAVDAPQNGDANGLVGTFTEITVPDGDYILYNNAFCTNEPAGTLNKIRANRAYLNLDAVEGGAPVQMPGRRYIGMSTKGENEATGYENITAPAGKTVKAIVNGQLIIIRDGEMYNAQGVRF